MSFSSLPPELLSMVCNLCDVPELKSLRATNRILAATIPLQKLFHEVVVYMTRASLEYAQNVARDEYLSKSVRSLWIQGDYPQQINNFEQFEAAWQAECRQKHDAAQLGSLFAKLCDTEGFQHLRDRLLQGVDTPSTIRKVTKTRLRTHLRQYKKLRKEALQIQKDSSIRNALRVLFQKCPNLNAIDYTLEHAIRSTTTEQNKQFAEGLLIPLGQPLPSSHLGMDGFLDIILAAAEFGFSPKQLKLGNVSSLVLSLPELLIRRFAFVKNLEILEWDFALPVEPITGETDVGQQFLIEDIFEAGHFYGFIQHASMLRELKVVLPFHLNETEPALTLTSLIGEQTFSHLTKFHVRTMWSDFGELTEFFLRHAETLDDVFLVDWALLDGLWSDVFEEIAGKLKNLKRFELRGAFDDDDSHWFGTLGLRDWTKCPPTKYGEQISRYVKGEISDYPEEPDEDSMWEDEPHTPSELDDGSDREDSAHDVELGISSVHKDSADQTTQDPLHIQIQEGPGPE